MSDLLAFLDEKSKPVYDNTSGGSGGSFSKGFLGKLMLSLENEMYLFHALGTGVDLQVHRRKWPAKPLLCPKVYYGEDCSVCEEDGYKNTRKVKNPETGEEEEVEVQMKKKPTRTHFKPCYLHNNTTGTKAAKNDSSKVYEVRPEVIGDWACGEYNSQTKAEKDRRIKAFKSAEEQGLLKDTLFMSRRKKVTDPKTKKVSDVTEDPVAINDKANLKYKIPRADQEDGYLQVENKASNLMVPSDIKEKWDNMTVGEEFGMILHHAIDFYGTDNKERQEEIRQFWQAKGVVFPSTEIVEEKKEEDTEV